MHETSTDPRTSPNQGADQEGSTGQASVQIHVASNDLMANLVGDHDSLLRRIEATFPEVQIHIRGNQVNLTGRQASLVGRLFGELVHILEKGHPLDQHTLERTIDMVRQGEEPAAVLTTEILRSARGKPVRPRSAGQMKYVEAIRDGVITFGIGPAGTGKSWLAVAMAVRALKNGDVDRIVLTRPLVEAGERVGFLPGDLLAKVDPYLRPLYDALFDMVDDENAERMLERNEVEVAPLAFMRGRTLSNAFIILDEAQNTSPEQMKMFLTRIGFGSKVVVTGDASQIDVPGGRSGLDGLEDLLSDIEDLSFVHLSSRDVVRHRIVQDIVNAYDEDFKKTRPQGSRAEPS
ncbi:MAG: PhoH family protein [Acidimicrobiales bacterium]|jgi:phosphate starvation-inducible PhoH-like protein